MIAKKKKLIRQSRSNSIKDNKNDERDKCPKNDKDCVKCKILNCPEER